MQAGTEGGEFEVQAAQRRLGVVYWLAGDSHVVPNTGVHRDNPRNKGLKTVIYDTLTG
jgi:hypothetical protein